MSHFTVLVTRTNADYNDVDKQLEPFDENRRMPKYVRKTKEQLIADSKLEVEEYAKGTYAKYLADPIAYTASCTNPSHLGYLKNEFPKKLEWTDEEHYQEAIKYLEKDDLTPEGGEYSEFNPDSKWDWYTVGGRWAGYFKLKPQAKGVLGKSGVFDNKPQHDADIALKRDIDFVAMKRHNAAQAKISWAQYQAKLAKDKNTDGYWDYGIEKSETREQYIKRCSSVAPFAILHKGIWYEKGRMGWWGLVSDKKDQDAWEETFKQILKDCKPSDELTIVDCHI